MANRVGSPINSGKELLKRFGFSNKERKLLWRLTSQEANTLAERIPAESNQNRAYFVEIRRVLPLLALHRRTGDTLRGSYLTPGLADAIKALSCIIYSQDIGDTQLTQDGFIRIANFSSGFTPTEPSATFQVQFDEAIFGANKRDSKVLQLRHAQHLLESFVAEYVQLSRNIDWEKDAIKHTGGWDCPLPIFEFLADPPWMLKWLFDFEWFAGKQLRYEEWGALSALWKHWHTRNHYHFDVHCDVENVRFWSCEVANHYAQWSASLPPDLNYRLIPITTQDDLDEESSELGNIAYISAPYCAIGWCRLFSIRETATGRRVATAEIRRDDDEGIWKGDDINGQSDGSLDFWKMKNPILAMQHISTLINAAAEWYNRDTRPKKIAFSLQFLATLAPNGRITQKHGRRDVYALTIRQLSSPSSEQNFVDLCFERGIILIGPGYAGSWPDCQQSLRSDGWAPHKITDIKRFAEDMKDGDLIVLRNDSNIVFGIGKINGDYEWLAEFENVDGWDMQHARRVSWLWKSCEHPNDVGIPVLKLITQRNC